MKLKTTKAAIFSILIGSAAFAQTSATPTSETKTNEPTTTTAATAVTSTASATSGEQEEPAKVRVDSQETREEFRQLLARYPPEVGKVLKLDPTLLGNTSYLATYPEIATFIAGHPEVAHTPRYFLEGIWIGDTVPLPPSQRVWNEMIEGFSILTVMGLVIAVASWIIRTFIEHRRWTRLSKVQTEVHTKLLDRFSTNEELLTYMQTSAGKRFLESAPIQLDANPRQMSAPFARILWSVQIGLVLMAGGIGLQLVSISVDKEVSQPIFALGVVGLSIGAGFILSAVASFMISRKLGLLESAEAQAD